MSLDFTDDQSTLAQIMAWCRQATSHYLSQCSLRSLSPYGITGQQWVKVYMHHISHNKLYMNSLFGHIDINVFKLCNSATNTDGDGALKQRGMMTSSNGIIVHITGPLCWEFTGHWWIPRTKASDTRALIFFHLRLNKRWNNQSWGWIWDAIALIMTSL